MQGNFLIQQGLLTINRNCLFNDDDQIRCSNTQSKTLLLKAFTKLLNVDKPSLEIVQFFRKGEFKANIRKFNQAFKKSDINLIEKNPEYAKHLLPALFLADNLGYVKVQSLPVGDKDGILVVDEQTQRAWLIAISFTRIAAQMHRQNLYSLEHMKGINLVGLNLKNVKRFFKMAITFFAKET